MNSVLRVLLASAAAIIAVVVAASAAHAREFFLGEWHNTSLQGQLNTAGYGDFIFLESPDAGRAARGEGSLVFVSPQPKSAVFGVAVRAYRFREEQPPALPPSVRLTADNNFDMCPSWYAPPLSMWDVNCAVSATTAQQRADQQSVTTAAEFNILAAEVSVDPAGRLLVNSNPMQVLSRIDTTTATLTSAIQDASSSSSSSTTTTTSSVIGNTRVESLWGGWCNGTHLRPVSNFSFMNYSDVPVPQSGEMSFEDVLTLFTVHHPTFLNDGSVVFSLFTFPCLFVAGPSTAWRVRWFVGNCSEDFFSNQTLAFLELVDPRTPRPRLDVTIGAVTAVHLDRARNRLYFAEQLGTVRVLDIAAGTVAAILGGKRFVPNPLLCEAEDDGSESQRQRCNPFGQVMDIKAIAVRNGGGAASPTDGEGDTVFVLDTLFRSVYSLNLRQPNRIRSEIVQPLTFERERGDCLPRTIAVSRADLFVLCSDGRTVMRKRLLAADTRPEPVVALPELDRVSVTAITAITTVLAVLGMPTVAVAAGRARAVMALARCDVTMPAGEPLSWAESPTQLAVGAGVDESTGEGGEFRYIAGAVVGNIALLVAAPLLVHWLAVQWSARSRALSLQTKALEQQLLFGNSAAAAAAPPAATPSNGNDLASRWLGDSGAAAPAAVAAASSSGAAPAAASGASAVAVDSALNSDPLPSPERVSLEAQSKLRFPSASFVFALMFTIEPTVRASGYLARFAPAGSWELAIGGIGFAFIGVSVCFIIAFFRWHFVAVFRPLEFQDDALDTDDSKSNSSGSSSNKSNSGAAAAVVSSSSSSPAAGQPGRSRSRSRRRQQQQSAMPVRPAAAAAAPAPRTGCGALMRRWYRRWKRFTHPFGRWRDNARLQHKRFGGLIKPYTERGYWWSVAELLSVAVLAALTGLKTQATCTGTAIAAVAVLWVFFIAGIYVRPMASPFDNVLQSVIAGLGAFSGLCLLAAAVPFFDDNDTIKSAFSIAETLALASAFLVGIDAFIDICSRAFKVLKFLWIKLHPRKPEAPAPAPAPAAPPSNAPATAATLYRPSTSPVSVALSSRSNGSANNGAAALRAQIDDDSDFFELIERQIAEDERKRQQQGGVAIDVDGAAPAALAGPVDLDSSSDSDKQKAKSKRRETPVLVPVAARLSPSYGDYQLDDDDDGDDPNQGIDDALLQQPDATRPARRRRTELMEYELLRQQLEAELNNEAGQPDDAGDSNFDAAPRSQFHNL